MITVALIGASGTGKSYRSIALAGEKGLDYIIDDGILINHNKVIAGVSAKKAATKIGAVKRAIFENEKERVEMAEAIKRLSPEGLLVLGTSEKMVRIIKNRLNLPEYSQIIHIEDISSPDDIEKAQNTRTSQGKHVIPVPMMEIKRTFSGYFLDPFSVFRKTSANDEYEEKTIVRPSYSYIGDFIINDTVLCDIARYEAGRISGVHSIPKISVEKVDGGVVFNLDIVVDYGTAIKQCAAEISDSIENSLEKYASIFTDAVNINIKSVNTNI